MTRHAHFIFWPIVVLAVAFDLWTKHTIFEWLCTKDNQTVSIIPGFLDFVIRENAGAAFSIALGRRWFLVIVSTVASSAAIGAFVFGFFKRKLVVTAVALFTAGALGNLYDRAFNHGFVRDFIDVYWRSWHWPAFNVADSLLCIAAGLLVISTILKPSPKTK